MALTNSGFDGTVTEAAWANMSALTDVDAVENSAAWAVTQGTGRQVSTAAQSGFAFAKGVLSKDTAAILTNLSTPVNGQWFLIVRHIDWATNGVTVAAVAHTTTTTTVPTVAPSTFPTIDNNPGVLYDQKLAWAWVRSTDTTVTLFDLRTLSAETRVAELESDVAALEAVTVGTVTAASGGTMTSATVSATGNLVHLRFALNRTVSPSAGIIIGTVDSGFRPPARTVGSGIDGQGNPVGILIDPDGLVRMYGSSGTGALTASAIWMRA